MARWSRLNKVDKGIVVGIGVLDVVALGIALLTQPTQVVVLTVALVAGALGFTTWSLGRRNKKQ
jgi:hypothetical protein